MWALENRSRDACGILAVMNHKQVAVLVPTTLLAQQHFENFKDRFANLPINVEVLSRFKTAKEQKVVLQNLAEGKSIF